MTEATNTTANTSALAVRRPAPISGYNPPPSEDEFRGMIYMAKQLSEVQGFVPGHFYKQPNKILAAMLYGRDLGITPTNALQHIIVIEGKATADAQLMGMLVRRAGHRLEDKTTAEASIVTITRADDGTIHTVTFTMQDAQRAGLVRQGSGWQKYPQAMLYARALTACARKGAQDALMGVAYTPEELGVETGQENGYTGEILPDQAAPESVAALQAAEPGVSEADGSPTQAAIQPTPPAPSAEVVSEAVPSADTATAPGEQTNPPPQTAPFTGAAPLSGASVSRRMGRAIGPQPKRTNVIEAPQASPAPTTTPVEPAEPSAQAQPADSLTDEPEPEDEGQRVYREQLRSDLRAQAAVLHRLNTIAKNEAHKLKGEPLEVVPPITPNDGSDEALRLLIERDFGGLTLATLDEAGLQNRLELLEPFIAKRRQLLKDKGLSE